MLPRDVWQCLETFLTVTTEGSVLLASSGYWLEMLLNISQYTGQSPTTKKSPAQNVSSAVAEKPWHKSKAWASESWSGAMNTCVHVFFFFLSLFLVHLEYT